MQYRTVFSKRPGLTSWYTHKIKLHNQTPSVKRSYPVPHSLRGEVEKTLQEMLELGVIKREASAYSSPMTVVKKKDGSVRICLDARVLNEHMVADCDTPPNVEELLQHLHVVGCLTTIDLRSSYWQIPLEKESRQYTAFSHNGRTFVYMVLPFGIKTAVGSFSRAIETILGPEIREFTRNYIDDILVAHPILKHIFYILKGC